MIWELTDTPLPAKIATAKPLAALSKFRFPYPSNIPKFNFDHLFDHLRNIFNFISGLSEVWYRAWFGTRRPWVQVPQPGPKPVISLRNHRLCHLFGNVFSLFIAVEFAFHKIYFFKTSQMIANLLKNVITSGMINYTLMLVGRKICTFHLTNMTNCAH